MRQRYLIESKMQKRTKTKIKELIELHPDEISTSNKLRLEKVSEDLDRLTASVCDFGIFQPIAVEHVDGKNELVSGYRRLQAAKKAGLEKVPCYLVEGYFAPNAGFIEHIYHSRLNPIDEAFGLTKYQEKFQCSQKELSNIIGKSEQYVSDTLKLITLPDDIKSDVLENNSVSKRELIKLSRIKDRGKIRNKYENLKNKKYTKKRLKKGSTPLDGYSGKPTGINETIKSIKEITAALRDLSDESLDEKDKNRLMDALNEFRAVTKTIGRKSYASYFPFKLLNIFKKKNKNTEIASHDSTQ